MKLSKLSKKGQVFDQFAALSVGIATLAIVLIVAFLIMAQAKVQIEDLDGVGSNTTAFNATNELIEATATIPPWIPLVVIAVIGAALLGLVALFRRR